MGEVMLSNKHPIFGDTALQSNVMSLFEKDIIIKRKRQLNAADSTQLPDAILNNVINYPIIDQRPSKPIVPQNASKLRPNGNKRDPNPLSRPADKFKRAVVSRARVCTFTPADDGDDADGKCLSAFVRVPDCRVLHAPSLSRRESCLHLRLLHKFTALPARQQQQQLQTGGFNLTDDVNWPRVSP